MPISDFVREYSACSYGRLHMPGHKGEGSLGEAYDITEIPGADDLYHPTGIIARSEAAAAALYGARRTCYSTEGSSQCIKAMLYLAVTRRPQTAAPVVLAGRNVHKSVIQAAALVDFRLEWLWPEGERDSLCACPITAGGLERALSQMPEPPCAVFVTSPDYLGDLLDIRALAQVAHRHGTILLVDNAHGAYLKMLSPSRHPLDLGCDMCCDSAHKTLPALTGGACLHIGREAPEGLEEDVEQAMALFGSTSPSYLILRSLEQANDYVAAHLHGLDCRFGDLVTELEEARQTLRQRGWVLVGEEPMKLTLHASASGWEGRELEEHLIRQRLMPEYADRDHVVLMFSTCNSRTLLPALDACLGEPRPPLTRPRLPLARGERVMSVRQAVFSPWERVPAAQAAGRICAAPTVSCPPAVPIVMAGETVTPEAVELFEYYGVETLLAVK